MYLLSFTLASCTPVLWPFIYDIHCPLFLYIYDDVCCSSPISPCVIFFLSLYTCFFMYAILYFYFTYVALMSFKYFRKTGCENLSCHELSSCKVFQDFMLELDLFYIPTSGYKFSDLRLLSWFICLLWFYHGLSKKEIIRTYVGIDRDICDVNWLIIWQNTLYL